MKAVVTSAILTSSALTATPASSEYLLDGVYEGAARDLGAVRVVVDGRDAVIRILAQGCLGIVEGRLAKNKTGDLFLVASDYAVSQCALAITPHGKFSFSLEQGPECTYHHGAMCSFNGFVERVR